MPKRIVCQCKKFYGVIDYHFVKCGKPIEVFYLSYREKYKFAFTGGAL